MTHEMKLLTDCIVKSVLLRTKHDDRFIHPIPKIQWLSLRFRGPALSGGQAWSRLSLNKFQASSTLFSTIPVP
jgi:hypothetical protein